MTKCPAYSPHHVRLKLLRRQAVVVIEDQQPRLRLARELGELRSSSCGTSRRTDGTCRPGAASFRPLRQPRCRMHFVDQHVAAMARIDRRLRRIRVAGDHDAAIGRVEAIAVALHRVLGRKRGDRDVRVLVDDAGGDLVRVHLVAVGERPLVAVRIGARLDVDPVGLEQVLGHRLDALGAVHLERHLPADRPGREDQVGVADGVIGMQMRHERDAQFDRL